MIHFTVLLWILIAKTYADNDPKIYDLKLISDFGESSFPVFSSDGRFLLFASKNQDYGNCTNVYRLDLNTPANESISLYSSGFGYEARPTLYDYKIFKSNSVVSTSFYVFGQINSNQKQSFTNSDYCPKSKCDSQVDPSVQKACTSNQLEYVEHPDYANLLRYNYDGYLNEYDSADQKIPPSNEWKNPELLINYHQIKAAFNKDISVFDGFNHNPSRQYNPNNYFFFHGYTTKEDWILKSIKKGVTPTIGSKIYRATYDQLNNGQEPDHFFKDGDTTTYLWPQSTNDPNKVLATGIDSNSKRASIYLLEFGKDPIRLTDPNYDSYHGTLDSTNKYIAFVSKRNNLKASVYFGKFLDSNTPTPQYNITKPDSTGKAISKAIKTYTCYKSSHRNRNTLFYKETKLNKDGKLMFIGKEYLDSCSQIFIVDTTKNDTSSVFKLGTGFHIYNSPNFMPNSDEILFGSTLTAKIFKIPSLTNDCLERVCGASAINKQDDPNLKTLCKNTNKEKPLPKEMELYVGDLKGTIKKRLTFNDGFDGEAALSSDGKTVVYSSFDTNDYDLFRMNIDGTGSREKLTNKLGFEGGTIFSLDDKLIAYYASRPQTRNEIDKYKQMMNYEFTDIGNQTEIYVYSFETNKEYQISNFGDTACHSPVFIKNKQDGKAYRLIFVCDIGYRDIVSFQLMYSTTFDAPNDSNLKHNVQRVDSYSYRIVSDLNLNGDKLAFSTQDDICITDSFDPDVSSAFKSGKLSINC
ncbi:hypothetical protein M3Y97_00296100 [Aphelenchoides bicaudatus]|nr:hypothetical protein M3Y97_00296100 [Aphelenchoides bicaudatus]